MGDFKIRYDDYFGVILEKNGLSIEISKSIQEDIYFRSCGSAEIIIKKYSRNEDEFEVYRILWSLMKMIVGQYFLTSDSIKDFIDIERKTVTISSDTGYDMLRITFNEDNNTIIISTIEKDKDTHGNVMVRIRNGNGSKYSEYSSSFDSFYWNLKSLSDRVMKRENRGQRLVKETSEKE